MNGKLCVPSKDRRYIIVVTLAESLVLHMVTDVRGINNICMGLMTSLI